MIPSNEDLENTGLELLLYQFSEKKNIKGLLKTHLSDLESVKKDLFSLVDSFNIEDASGVYLDYIGNLVGEKRQGDNDEVFRERIRLRVAINNSDATPNTLLEILSTITNSENVRVWEHFPVSSVFYTDGKNADTLTLNAMKSSAPITSELVLIVDTTRKGFVGTELLPNYQDKPKQTILAELLETFDFLVDESNNNIVSDQGDNIIVFSGGGDTVSYYGKMNEIIA